MRSTLLSCSTPAIARSWKGGLSWSDTVDACVPAGWKPPPAGYQMLPGYGMPAGCDGVVGSDGVVGADGAEGCDAVGACACTASGSTQTDAIVSSGLMVRCFFKGVLALSCEASRAPGHAPIDCAPCGIALMGIFAYTRVLTNGSVGLVG